MTDKKPLDQNQDALRSAFDKLNARDELQPSAELDALILQQAADVVTKDEAATNTSTDTAATVTDISFRRGQREATSRKQVLPKWAMPMAVAATVLVTSGIFLRVLQSPEFNELGNPAASSATVYSDSAEISGQASSNNNKPAIVTESLDNTGEILPGQYASEKPEALKEQREQEFAQDTLKTRAAKISSPDRKDELSGMADGALRDTTTARQNAQQAEQQKMDSDKRQREAAAEQVAQQRARLMGNASVDSRGDRVKIKSPVPEKPPAPVAKQVSDPTVNPEEGFAATKPETLSSGVSTPVSADVRDEQDLMIEEVIIAPVAETSPGIAAAQEVVVTGAPMEKNVLSEVQFEHRTCQVSYDCELLALECESCDCLQTINRSELDAYNSEFTPDEIRKQCEGYSVECDLGYCQVKQKDTASGN